MPGRTFRTSLAHMPGRCSVATTPTGNITFSTGPDATIRPHDTRDTPTTWWRQENVSEPELPDLTISDLHDKPINALAVAPTGTTLATASDDGFIRLFSLNAEVQPIKTELIQACARFGGPAKTLDFSPTGAFLAAGGDEPGVLKIVMTAQPSNVTVLRASGKGCEALVDVKFDPDGDFVASVGERGGAVVWDVERCTMAAVVDLNGRKAKCVAWAMGGGKVVFGTDRGLVVVGRDSWNLDHLLVDVEEEGEVGVCSVAWSLNGRFLVAGREDGGVVLWDTEEKKVLGVWRGREVVQRVCWHPKGNVVCVVDAVGEWGVLGEVVPAHLPKPWEEIRGIELPGLPEVDEEEVVKRGKRKEKKVKKKKKKEEKKDKEEETDEEEDNQLENGFVFHASDVEADDEEDVKRGEESESGEESGSDEEVPGELADLENAGFRLPARRRGSAGKAVGASWVAPVLQEAFVPTSTPLAEKERKKRCLFAWNLVGAVVSYDESTHDVVEIEFADASRRNIGIKDHFGYTMGCLSETGVLLASPTKKEHGSLITFRPFSSWSNNSDWTMFMPNEEDVAVVALGGLFAAVATKPNNLVRIFSLTGIQTAVFGIQGTIVTAAANDDRLVVVYAEPHSSALRCEMYDMSSIGEVEKVRYAGPVVLCPGSKLEWIGFATDTKELCTYDSNGWLWVMMDPKVGKRWVPMMQNAAHSAQCDWFWVASATSTNLIGAPCLSNERYPQAKPRPALRTLHLSAPVVDKVAKSGKPTVMERFMRTKYRLNRALCAKADADDLYDSDDENVGQAEYAVARMEVETDKCLLALMEEACRNEQNMRALDLATRLHAKISFRYAVELARHFKREALASRVQQVASRKIEVIEQDEQLRAGFKKSTKTSPVTPAPMESEALEWDEKPRSSRPVTRNSRWRGDEQKGLVGFESEDEEPVREKKSEKAPGFSVADVTDDEEELEEQAAPVEESEDVDAPETEVPKQKAEQTAAAKSEQVKKESRKRSAPVQASQASATGFFKGKGSHVAKKAKTGKSEKAKVAAGANRKFHNRFLKK